MLDEIKMGSYVDMKSRTEGGMEKYMCHGPAVRQSTTREINRSLKFHISIGLFALDVAFAD